MWGVRLVDGIICLILFYQNEDFSIVIIQEIIMMSVYLVYICMYANCLDFLFN